MTTTPKPRAKMAIAGVAGSFTQAVETTSTPTPQLPTRPVPSSRIGRVALPFWVPSTARQQLRHLVTDLNLTAQEAMTEALNEWFVKHGKPPIA